MGDDEMMIQAFPCETGKGEEISLNTEGIELEKRMNPVIEWKIEKDQDILKIYLTTKDKPEDECFDKTYLYTYALQDAIRENEPFSEVYLYINSRGGDYRSADGIMDALRKIPRWIPIRTLINGQCSSAATLFLGLRGGVYMTPESTIFIHRGTQTTRDEDGVIVGESSRGQAVDACQQLLSSAYRRAMRKNLSIGEYLRKKNMTKVWAASEIRMTAEQAALVGLVTGILGRKAFEAGEKTVPEMKRQRARGRMTAAVCSAVIFLTVICWVFVGYWQADQERAARKARAREITAGTVVEKIYHPYLEGYLPVNYMSNSGTVVDSAPAYQAEGWFIKVRDDEGYEVIWSIKEETYNKLEVGSKVRAKGK